MEEFVVTEKVGLKSGGPTMLVEKISEALIECVWIDATGKVQRSGFTPELLVKHRSGIF